MCRRQVKVLHTADWTTTSNHISAGFTFTYIYVLIFTHAFKSTSFIGYQLQHKNAKFRLAFLSLAEDLNSEFFLLEKSKYAICFSKIPAGYSLGCKQRCVEVTMNWRGGRVGWSNSYCHSQTVGIQNPIAKMLYIKIQRLE